MIPYPVTVSHSCCWRTSKRIWCAQLRCGAVCRKYIRFIFEIGGVKSSVIPDVNGPVQIAANHGDLQLCVGLSTLRRSPRNDCGLTTWTDGVHRSMNLIFVQLDASLAYFSRHGWHVNKLHTIRYRYRTIGNPSIAILVYRISQTVKRN